YYEVSATGGSQESQLSAAVRGITIAAVPLGLTIDSVFAKTAIMVWQADTGASSYAVYRRPNDTAAFAAVGASATDTFTDTGLSPGTRYSYAVSAVNMSGESQKSSPARLLTIPAAPQIAVDSALSSSSALVVWGTVTGATAYKVYRSDSAAGAFALAGATAADTFFVDTGRAGGGKYFHEVTALDSSGESAPSAIDSAITP
ncbi:MAG TPA: fibronectin type III domain-containing protein, partial [Chitinivibrionales bacterium]|nr:fibronectin type III domain-containing protein [Chitinivibrionales bacterium]